MTAFCKPQGLFLLVMDIYRAVSSALPVIPLSLPFHRGKPEIIGSNLDVLVTVGLAERVYEDYHLAEEVCNAISKLANNSKVKFSLGLCSHRNSYLVKEKQGTELTLRKENLLWFRAFVLFLFVWDFFVFSK